MKWYTTYDWKTPATHKDDVGGGEAEDFYGCCQQIKEWIKTHIPKLAYPDQYWRYIHIKDPKWTLIYFGSHVIFALVEHEEDLEEEDENE